MLHAEKILRRLAHRNAPKVLSTLKILTSSLVHCVPAPRDDWSSDITDDGTPYEFSFSFGPKGIEFRVLWEAQAAIPTSVNMWAAAERTNSLAESMDGVELGHLR